MKFTQPFSSPPVALGFNELARACLHVPGRAECLFITDTAHQVSNWFISADEAGT